MEGGGNGGREREKWRGGVTYDSHCTKFKGGTPVWYTQLCMIT